MTIEESSVRAMGGQGTDKRISGSASGAQFVLVTVHDDDSGGGGGGTVTYKVAVDTAAGGTWTLDLESDHFYQGVGSVNTYNHGDLITINATAYDEAGNGTAAPATVFAVSEFGPQFAQAETIDNVLGNYSYSATNLKVGDFNGDGFDDFAGIYRGNSDQVRLFYSDGVVGSTNLGGQTNKSVGSGLDAMDVGDVTGDGIDDIVAINSDERLVVIQGDGTQQSTHISELPTSSIYDMLLFDYDGDGDQDLAIANNNISGGAELHVYTNDGNGNFVSGYSYEVGQNIYGLAKADFDGGGKEDLIFTTSSSSDNAHLLISTSTTDTPSFNAVPYAKNALLSGYGEGLVVDYLGSDTLKQDVVVGDTEKFTIFYDMEETGVAASSTDVYYSGGGEDPRTIELMDYDGDGNKDIIAIYQNSGTGEPTYDAAVFLTNDTGQITESFILVDGSGENYAGAAILDYNNDGIDDILITNQTNNQDVMVLRGGAALQAGNIGTASGPTGVNQLNAESASSNASLLLRVDASTIAVGQTIELFDPSGNSIFSTTTASDGSGGVQGLSGDYLTITLDSAAMTALSALGDGNHTLRVDMADAFQNTVSASIMIEQATTLPTLTVDDTVLNENSPGSISDDSVQITGTSTDANYILVTIADDGVGSSPNTATYRVNPDSSGAWTLDLDTATPTGGTATTVDQNDTFSITASAHGDLNNTGTTATATDFIVSGPGPQFAEAETIDNVLANYSYAMNNLKVGDFNGDGFDDFAGIYRNNDNDVRLYFTDGVVGSTTTTRMSKAARSNLDAMDVGDVTGDGIDDVVYMDGSEYLMTLQGDGTLSSTYIYQLPTSDVRDMVLFDYDGDGDLDLALGTANTTSGQEIHVYTNDGNGNFISAYSYETNLDTRGLSKGDFNNDGKEDLITATTSSNYNHRLFISTSTTDTPSFDIKIYTQDNFAAAYGEGLVVDYLGSDTQKQDVIIGDSSKFTIFYDMEDTGSYASTTDIYYSNGGEDPISIELMDYDGDGTKDIIAVYQNSGGEPTYDAAVFLTNDTGQVTESFILIESSGENYAGAAILDYNNDGIEDILITSQNTNQDVLVLRGGGAVQAANIGTASGPTGMNQLNAESLTSNASLALRVDPATITIGHTVKLFDPSGNSIFTTTLQNDGSNGVQGLSGDYLTLTLNSAAMTSLAALGDGNHTLSVEMADAFNNGASTNITIEQASTVPTISVDDTVLNENGAGSITDDSVQITGTSSDANYILVTVADDGGGSSANTATYKVNPDSSGTWTLDLDTATPQGGTATTADNGDTFSVTASAHGTLNNTGTTATANDYVVDLFAPTLMPQYDTDDYYEFAWPVTNYVTNYYNAGTFGDVNGDGNIDFAATLDGTGNDAGVFYGNNGGTFDDQGDIALVTSQSVRTTELVDLNGDGYDDMIIIDRRYVYTVLADGNGGFENTTNLLYDSGNTYLGDMYGAPVSTGDFNGDGHMDFAFTNAYANEIAGGLYTFMGNGTGTSFDDQFLRIEDSQYTVNTVSQMADIDNDGDADMVYFKRGRNSPWSFYLTVTAGQNNTGTPLVQNWSQTIYTGYDNSIMTNLEVADLNGDGWQDIAFTYRNTPYIDVYLNTQSGSYSSSYSSSSSYVTSLDLNAILGRTVTHVNDLNLMDIDGDGDTDILLGLGSTTSSYIDEQVILTQNADGSFSEFSAFDFDDAINIIDMSTDRGEGHKVQYEDFNGDGVLDTFMMNRALSNNSGSDPRIYWGRVATVTGDVINQDNEILTVALGDATAAGDTLVVTYNGNQIGTATTTATDISNGSMDITLNNVENLYNGGRNQLTFTISDALGGTNTYLQSMEVATNSAASNSYILHFDGEADTLTSFTAGDGAGGDKMNISQLLNDAGYTGAIDWTTLESGGYISRADDGSGNTIISVDKDGTAGTTHDLQHIVTLNNVTAANLDDDDIE